MRFFTVGEVVDGVVVDGEVAVGLVSSGENCVWESTKHHLNP